MPRRQIDRFNLKIGTVLADKYEIVGRLGRGWEGEVFRVRELRTGVERAAKLFYPKRNPGNRAFRFHARKLHKLRGCSILIQYHAQEQITYRGHILTLLISELVEGERLSRFLSRQRGQRLLPFEALHLLRDLAGGVAEIHEAGEYHGDLHTENILIRRYGLSFRIKLLDLQNLGPPGAGSRHEDVCDLIRIFYDALGGQPTYARHPQWVKDICCGLKRTLIRRKFRTATHLCRYLDHLDWQDE